MKICGYVRVSSAEQATEGYSIGEQQERIKKYCEAHGWELAKVYADPGISGASMKRPGLQEMIKDIKKGCFDKVVVYKLDRLSRSQKDTLYLIEDVFLKNGTDFESMNERFDTASSFGRAMIGILAVFAQLEREQIKERMTMGKEGRAKTGKWHGGAYPPTGYDYKDGALVVNPAEAEQIKELFDRYTKGESIKAIEADFREKGYQGKKAPHTLHSLKKILDNKVYIGIIKHKGEEYQGEHEPLIDEGAFYRAQEIRAITQNRRGRSSNKTYLTGLLYCARCGAKYSCGAVSDDKRFRYYSCYSRRKGSINYIKDPNCKNKTWRVDKLDSLIFEEIKKLELSPEMIDAVYEEKHQGEKEQKAAGLRNQLRKVAEQRKRLIDLYAFGNFTPEELQSHIKPLEARQGQIEKELAELMEQSPLSLETAKKAVFGFSDILSHGEYDQIRLVIETLIEKVVIDGEDITIYWRF